MSEKKFHINPETGLTGECSAKIRDCKFAVGNMVPEHYDSKEEAIAASERILAEKHGTFTKAAKIEDWSKIPESTEWNETLSKELAKTITVEAVEGVLNHQSPTAITPAEGFIGYEMIYADTDAMVESLLNLKKSEWPKSLKKHVVENVDEWITEGAESWGVDYDSNGISNLTEIPFHVVESVNEWYFDKDPKVQEWEDTAKQEFGLEQYNSRAKGRLLTQDEYNNLPEDNPIVQEVKFVADAYRQTRFSSSLINDSPRIKRKLKDVFDTNAINQKFANPNFVLTSPALDAIVDTRIDLYKKYYDKVKNNPVSE